MKVYETIGWLVVAVCFAGIACIAGMVQGKRIGREIGYTECVEAINSITYGTPNEIYNEGAEAMKSSAIAQIGCYREERK